MEDFREKQKEARKKVNLEKAGPYMIITVTMCLHQVKYKVMAFTADCHRLHTL